MAGGAGEFHSVTWPGFVGVLTGMAPGRFAGSINQAPMWRRTRHPWLRPVDMMANAAATWPLRHMPPDQLLRHVFETARDFASAQQLLETTPIARPVIYTLAGCKAGERCVIERTIDGFNTRTEDTGAANDWLKRLNGWEGRIGANIMFTCSHDDAGANSRGRHAALVVGSALRGRVRLGDRAGAQSLYAHRRGDVRSARHPARGRIRDRAGLRASATRNADVQDRCARKRRLAGDRRSGHY